MERYCDLNRGFWLSCPCEKAAAVFVECNGDSELARLKLAALLRQEFLNSNISRDVEDVKADREHAAQFIDWIYEADQLLWCCSEEGDLPVGREPTERENQRREAEYRRNLRNYRRVRAVHGAITIIRKDPEASDETILEKLTKRHIKAKPSDVREARLDYEFYLERQKDEDTVPSASYYKVQYKVERPVPPARLGFYEPLYVW